jgi:hypothetical protein
MKHLLILISLVTFNPVFGGQEKIPYEKYACNEKNLPILVKYNISDRLVKVEIEFAKELQDYQVQVVRGLDGLTVSNFAKQASKNVLKSEKDAFEVGYNKPDGLSYLVLEVRGKLNNLSRVEMIAIPVGKLSDNQKKLRQTNIINRRAPSEDGLHKSLTQKVHRMRLETVK